MHPAAVCLTSESHGIRSLTSNLMCARCSLLVADAFLWAHPCPCVQHRTSCSPYVLCLSSLIGNLPRVSRSFSTATCLDSLTSTLCFLLARMRCEPALASAVALQRHLESRHVPMLESLSLRATLTLLCLRSALQVVVWGRSAESAFRQSHARAATLRGGDVLAAASRSSSAEIGARPADCRICRRDSFAVGSTTAMEREFGLHSRARR